MKTMRMAVVGTVAALAFFAACSDDRLVSVDEEQQAGEESTVGEASPAATAEGPSLQSQAQALEWYDLRLRSSELGTLSAVMLDVTQISVYADGHRMPVELGPRAVDLAVPNQAWLVGRFALPAGAKEVQVQAVLDTFGAYEAVGQAGYLDNRSVPISFETTPAQLAARRHAVVDIDLSRSLIGSGEAVVLLPNYRVRY